MLNQLAKIKRALIKCGRAKRFDAGVAKRLLATMGYFSDRSVPYSLSASDFIAYFPLPNLLHNAEKTFLGFVDRVHFIFQYAADEVGDSDDPVPSKTILFFAVEVKNGFYLRKNYEKLAREITKRFSFPTVVLFLSKFNDHNACLTFSFVDRKKHGKFLGQTSLGGNITIVNIDCRRPQREHLDLLLGISLANSDKKKQDKAAFVKDLCASWLAPELLEEAQNIENVTAHAILCGFFVKVFSLAREQGYIDEIALYDSAAFNIFDRKTIFVMLEKTGIWVPGRSRIRDISIFDITKNALYSFSDDAITEQAEKFASLVIDIYNLEQRHKRDAGKSTLLDKRQEKEIAKAMILEKSRNGIATSDDSRRPARKRMIESNLRLAASLAYQHRYSKLPMADLIQEGNVGLMTAVEKFDFRRGFRFSTYATHWIRQAITRAIAEKELMIHVPVHRVEKHKKIKAAERELLQKNGVQPTIEVLSKRTQIPVKKIHCLLKNFEMQPNQEQETTPPFVGVNDFSDEYDEMESRVFSKQIVPTMLDNNLTKKEAEIISLRYGIGVKREYTLEEIGRIHNVTRERIRQIEVKALRKLKRKHLPLPLFKK